jgi:hypothetical protein
MLCKNSVDFFRAEAKKSLFHLADLMRALHLIRTACSLDTGTSTTIRFHPKVSERCLEGGEEIRLDKPYSWHAIFFAEDRALRPDLVEDAI